MPSMLQRVFKKVFKRFCEQFAKWKNPNLFQKFFDSGTSSTSTLSFHTSMHKEQMASAGRQFSVGLSQSLSHRFIGAAWAIPCFTEIS